MDKKKILIISLYGNNNYGNKLQNYALQEVLKEFGYDVETFVYLRENTPNSSKELRRISYNKYFKAMAKNFLLAVNNNMLKSNLSEAEKIRVKNIENFDKLIKKSPINPMDQDYQKINKSYDYIVFGSDQVWNPFFISNVHINFGTKLDKDKKLSYSASFGVSELDKKTSSLYKELLAGFKPENISVREDAGADLVESLTGRKVQVLVDPTMLLKGSEWEKLAKTPKNKPQKDFILTYVLGDMSDKRRDTLERLAKENNLALINMMDKENLDTYTSGVEEFLWYLSHARLIIADSFHAGVFSILFNKDFYILDRQQNVSYTMNSRFETLLSKFDLEERYLKDIEKVDIKDKIDYGHVKELLDKERERSYNFLEEIIG